MLVLICTLSEDLRDAPLRKRANANVPKSETKAKK